MPSGMSIFQAYPLLALGYQIRREIWADAGITGQVLPPGAGPLRWIRLHRDAGWLDNCAWIRSATFERVVTAADFTGVDARAHDWTTEGVNVINDPGNDWTDPNDPGGGGGGGPIIDPPPGGTGGGGGGPIIDPPPGGTGGGGSGSGGDGSGGKKPRPKPTRLGASLTVSLSRADDACVARNEVGVCPASTTNQWSGNITLIDPAAKPGELWSVTVLNCRTRLVDYHGIMAAGDTIGFGLSAASGPPGSGFAFSATGFLFGAGGRVTAQGSARATFPDCCALQAYGPDASHYYAPDESSYYARP